MASQDFEIRGYGIQFDRKCGCDTTVERIRSMLALAPAVQQEVDSWFKAINLAPEDVLVEDYADFDQDNYCGIPALIAKVIREVEDIYIESDSDDDGIVYLFLCACMPWEFSDKEQNLTEDELCEIFRKYWNMLYDGTADIGRVSIHKYG